MTDRARAADAIEAFLAALGLDSALVPELRDTGRRVADAFADDFLRGYRSDPAALLRGSLVEATTEVVVVRGLAVTTMCPHHLLLAEGTATVAFAPRGKAVGLGALVAVVGTLAARLVLQESLGEDVVSLLQAELEPRWVACRLVLRHGCMTGRGERAHGSTVETLATRGLEAPHERADALRIVLGAA